jgi:hypothetical protein
VPRLYLAGAIQIKSGLRRQARKPQNFSDGGLYIGNMVQSDKDADKVAVIKIMDATWNKSLTWNEISKSFQV